MKELKMTSRRKGSSLLAEAVNLKEEMYNYIAKHVIINSVSIHCNGGESTFKMVLPDFKTLLTVWNTSVIAVPTHITLKDNDIFSLRLHFAETNHTTPLSLADMNDVFAVVLYIEQNYEKKPLSVK